MLAKETFCHVCRWKPPCYACWIMLAKIAALRLDLWKWENLPKLGDNAETWFVGKVFACIKTMKVKLCNVLNKNIQQEKCCEPCTLYYIPNRNNDGNALHLIPTEPEISSVPMSVYTVDVNNASCHKIINNNNINTAKTMITPICMNSYLTLSFNLINKR